MNHCTGFLCINCLLIGSDAFLAGDRLRRQTTDCQRDKTRAKIGPRAHSLSTLANRWQKSIFCEDKYIEYTNLEWNLLAPSAVYKWTYLISISENLSIVTNHTFLQNPRQIVKSCIYAGDQQDSFSMVQVIRYVKYWWCVFMNYCLFSGKCPWYDLNIVCLKVILGSSRLAPRPPGVGLVWPWSTDQAISPQWQIYIWPTISYSFLFTQVYKNIE